METVSRLFNCARCYRSTIICSHCDRGNIYCGQTCSIAARQKSVKAIRIRYEVSLPGRRKHAERQRRYRQRQKIKKVTDQGSLISSADDLLLEELNTSTIDWAFTKTLQQCHFCGVACSVFVRAGWIRRATRIETSRNTSWPLGP
jgi:hypothetical protein